ncbi:putative RNA recognition motif domain, nucleotide-binding alpha-beta plait domain superfamily [Helianthus debilis subsp. tardiflorus]
MEVEDEGGPWLGPKGKGEGSGKGFNHRIVKFFVSNIPKGCRPWDLANTFRGFGDIAGAFITKKKDKEGKTFAFVYFKGVLDAAGLEASMENMKLGGNKLSVNVARFTKENVASFSNHVGCSNRAEGPFKKNGLKADSVNRKPAAAIADGSKGRSFVDILLNKSSPSLEVDDVVEVDSSIFSLADKFGKALVGRTLNFMVLR